MGRLKAARVPINTKVHSPPRRSCAAFFFHSLLKEPEGLISFFVFVYLPAAPVSTAGFYHK